VGARKLGGVEHEAPVELAVAIEAALAVRAFEDLIGPAGAVVQLHCHAYDPEDGPRGTRRRAFPPVTLRADQVREVHSVPGPAGLPPAICSSTSSAMRTASARGGGRRQPLKICRGLPHELPKPDSMPSPIGWSSEHAGLTIDARRNTRTLRRPLHR
jgi:hypothetical protein